MIKSLDTDKLPDIIDYDTYLKLHPDDKRLWHEQPITMNYSLSTSQRGNFDVLSHCLPVK